MGRDIEIRTLLFEIAKTLNKLGLLDNSSYESIISNISDIRISELSRLACQFLSLALSNNRAYAATRNYFDRIYNAYINSYLDRSNVKDSSVYTPIKLLKDKYHLSMLDYFFEEKDLFDGLKLDGLSIIIPIESKDKILEQFYQFGADIYDMEHEPFETISASSEVVFKDGISIDVYDGYIDGDNLKINELVMEGDKVVRRVRTINKEILPLCFKNSDKGVRIETPEFRFIRSIERGREFDFISAMLLKGKINMKKVGIIKKGISTTIEEEKKNGLQKTS